MGDLPTAPALAGSRGRLMARSDLLAAGAPRNDVALIHDEETAGLITGDPTEAALLVAAPQGRAGRR